MLNDTQKISAVAWAAGKQGLSYGLFSAMLTEEKHRQIYKEYEDYLKTQQGTEKTRNRRGSKKLK